MQRATSQIPLSLLALFLALLLLLLDFMPLLQGRRVEAYQPVYNQGEVLLSFLGLGEGEPISVTAQAGEVITLPDLSLLPETLRSLEQNLSGILRLYPAYNLNPESENPLLYFPLSSLTPSLFSQLLPPAGSPLYWAYRQGGQFFYEEGDQVILILPDKSTQSYFKSTGFESSFLQETLSYPPIAFPGAIEKYMREYGGSVVAQTEEWVLMKFPAGGFLKVAR